MLPNSHQSESQPEAPLSVPAMQMPPSPGEPARTAPSFYLTGRQPLRPAAILLAIVAAAGALASVLYALGHTGHGPFGTGANGADRSSNAATGTGQAADDDKDDPNQIDTIVLGDPSDAPVPGRKGDHVSPVHPTIIIRLPRYGDQVGLIPDSPAGHLLYGWLAAFNHASESALAEALPSVATGPSVALQMELRRQSGGYQLLSAKEVQPGVIVFRLRDQTPLAGEVLGTLQVRPGSNPAAIGSFSLRAVPAPRRAASAGVASAP